MCNITKYVFSIGFVFCLMSPVACGDDDGENGNANTTPVPLDPTEFTYQLNESTAGLILWTTPCTHKVLTNERAPEDQRSGLKLSAARNEFEPVQLILGPASGSVTVEVDPFPSLGAGQRVDLAEAGFESGWAETLSPLASGGSVSLLGDRGIPVWLTVYVPPGAPAGDHFTSLRLTHSAGTITVPVSLYVFDFDLPAEAHFSTQLNVSVGGLVPDGGTVDDAKDLLWEHRFTPKSVTWPSGFNWGITWENSRSTDPCEILWDEPDEPDQYAIGWLAQRYMLGVGWNGVGFPTSMIFQFVDNSTPRPASFCGLSRGDHYGSSDYNAEWSQFLGALETYLQDNGMLANGGHPQVGVTEPLDQTAASVASSLTSWTKNADALMALRHELGRYIEGSRPDLPVLEIQSSARPRGEYYLSFQDPAGSPTADPLVVDGKTYLKIGWQAYNDDDHYGWYGENVGNPTITQYGYDDVGGYNEAQRSYVYDDYGRDSLFEFALENGRYDVTICVGRPSRGYPGDPHNATVEGTVVVDDEITTDGEPIIERTITVDLMDGSLSIEVGGRSESSGDWAYTFLGYVDIVPVD